MKLPILYTAGLIDGEGTITLSYKRKINPFRYPVVSVASTTIEIILALRETYGGSVCKHKVYKTHHLKSYIWRVCGSKAIELCGLLSPLLLVPEKKYRADLIAIEYPRVTEKNGKYTDATRTLKIQFENRFFHPSKP